MAQDNLNTDALANALEERMNFCFHCGTPLDPWKPAIFKDGKEVAREDTPHKWCKNCLWVVAHTLRVLLTGVKNA